MAIIPHKALKVKNKIGTIATTPNFKNSKKYIDKNILIV
jgi:hypothetical protein